ncbi:SUMO1 [Enterospora canceri]|uniref:SUMO1 n=1 Tax=Enterospora canceri TaxID=1081671 RepID=A0A1Y1S760_9MICR|nr:SUMO1 [Enterospora canceri]
MISNENEKSAGMKEARIGIRIESPNGQYIKMSSKPSNKVKKVLEAYCKSNNVEASNYRLVFKNQFLNDDYTLKSYEIGDGDIIYVMPQQTGGCV